MVTLASIIQICNVPPKRLIHLIIFIVISLKFNQTEDPSQTTLTSTKTDFNLKLKNCWTAIKDHKYFKAYITTKTEIEECKKYCETGIRKCNLIYFDTSNPRENSCYVTNDSETLVLNDAFFEKTPGMHSYLLDFECHRKAADCWVVKGDHTYPRLREYLGQRLNLERCKDECLSRSNCDIIVTLYSISFGFKCYIKDGDEPLHHITPSLGSKLYLYTCHPASDGMSLFGKYYIFMLVAAIALV